MSVEQHLRPGEGVIYRSKPALGDPAALWFMFFALMNGFFSGYFAYLAIFQWEVDWPGMIAVYVFMLMLLVVFGLGCATRAAMTRVWVTDQQVIYRTAPFLQIEKIDRQDIDRLLAEDESITGTLVIVAQSAWRMNIRWVADLNALYQLLAAGKQSSFPSPLSGKATAVLLFGLFGLFAVGWFTLMLELEYLLAPILEPWHELQNSIFVQGTPMSDAVDFLTFIALAILLFPPLAALASGGAFLGFLPAVLLARVVLSPREAQRMATEIGRQSQGQIAMVTIPYTGFAMPILDRLLRFWLSRPWRFYIGTIEALLSRLYGQPIRCK